MKRNVKKLQAMLSMLLVLCMSIINLGTIQANAAEVEEELDYVIINGTESGTISGLVNGGKYTVTISTGEELPDNYYLEGSGTITS